MRLMETGQNSRPGGGGFASPRTYVRVGQIRQRLPGKKSAEEFLGKRRTFSAGIFANDLSIAHGRVQLDVHSKEACLYIP